MITVSGISTGAFEDLHNDTLMSFGSSQANFVAKDGHPHDESERPRFGQCESDLPRVIRNATLNGVDGRDIN